MLSPSTEEYDRSEKFDHYKKIPSLRDYVLVGHERREIQVWTHEPDGEWSRKVKASGKAAQIPSLDCTLDVSSVYNDATEPAGSQRAPFGQGASFPTLAVTRNWPPAIWTLHGPLIWAPDMFERFPWRIDLSTLSCPD